MSVQQKRFQYCWKREKQAGLLDEAYKNAKQFHQRYTNFLSRRNKVGPKRIAIIGGGVAGLYAAYKFQTLDVTKGSVSFTIFEKESKTGGRIETHRFNPDPTTHQYVEFGAMRIPEDHMPLTDENTGLFKEMGIPLIDFIMSAEKDFYYLDRSHKLKSEFGTEDLNKFGFMRILQPDQPRFGPGGPVDFSSITLLIKSPNPDAKRKYESVATLYASIYDFLYQELTTNAEAFFAFYDHYSAYSGFRYLVAEFFKEDQVEVILQGQALKNDDPAKQEQIDALVDSMLHYGEVTQSGTNLSHVSLVESVIDDSHFRNSPGSTEDKKWKTPDGGMQLLTDKLEEKVGRENIKFNTQVMKLERFDEDNNPATNNAVIVYWETHENGITTPGHDTFDAVLVTAPFGSVRFMDLHTMDFSYGKKQAIRALNYDQATKIFAHFPNKWWQKELNHVGGSSRTNLPLISVTYPSYGLDKPNDPGAILASYTWHNDALLWTKYTADRKREEEEETRIKGRQRNSQHQNESLKRVVFDQLQLMHNRPITPAERESATVVHKTFFEGFALFRPGQFKLMVNAMIPENGVHFAGEHLSVNHAWILGAINSANRAIREILIEEDIVKTSDEAWDALPDYAKGGEFTRETWNEYATLF